MNSGDYFVTILANIYLSKIWFPNDVGTIHIITSTEGEKREQFSSPTSDNYMLLESLGDKDSLLEVTAFLNRNYRNTNWTMYAADGYANNMEGNFVVIGGPGDEEGDGSKDQDIYGNNGCKSSLLRRL